MIETDKKTDSLAYVGEVLNHLGLLAKRQVTFTWMSNRVPLDGDVPPRIRYRLMAVHSRLGGDWERLEQKRRSPLHFDFQVEETTLIAVDRRHSFTSARNQTLGYYEGLQHSLPIPQYRDLCHKFSDKADRYQAKRDAPDFPFSGGRGAQRAYFDIAKDLVVPANGYRLIRLPAADAELIEGIELRLRVLL